MTSLLRCLCVAALAVAMLPTAPATADAHGPGGRWHRPVPVRQPLVSVNVVDGRGIAFPSARHRGKVFVAGERGERYELQLTNNTRERLEVVVSVDGRDVVSGQRASFSRHRGYVLEPFATVTIDGFRRSLDNVAAFRFSSAEDSYTARRGTPRGAGVIGVAVFREQARRRAPLAKNRRSPAAGDDFVEFEPRPGTSRTRPRDPSTSAAPPADKKGRSATRRWHSPTPQELGTAFGETRRSAARRVTFVRRNSSRPDFTTNVFYDSARALAARGVPIEPIEAIGFDEPAPWSGEPRFAPPPPPRGGGWRR